MWSWLLCIHKVESFFFGKKWWVFGGSEPLLSLTPLCCLSWCKLKISWTWLNVPRLQEVWKLKSTTKLGQTISTFLSQIIIIIWIEIIEEKKIKSIVTSGHLISVMLQMRRNGWSHSKIFLYIWGTLSSSWIGAHFLRLTCNVVPVLICFTKE